MYNYAGTLGIPSVLIERGGIGQWTDSEAEESAKDIRNILRSIDILKTKHEPTLHKLYFMRHVHYIESTQYGYWFPLVIILRRENF